LRDLFVLQNTRDDEIVVPKQVEEGR
jgi:hypothetical protein